MTDKIYTAMVGNDVDGGIYSVDVIKHDGKLWLVPHWLEVPSKKVSMPARMIRFDNQPHQQTSGSWTGDYILNGPVPKDLLGPTTPKQKIPGWEYLELPEVEIPESVRPIHTGRKIGEH